VAAEDAPLPKDETGAGAISSEEAEAPLLSDYDKLYVGADGKTTAEGGKLLGLYTAYADDTTVDIAGGTWKNKMDASGETDALLRDTSKEVSFAKEENGFGYHMTRAQIAAEKKKKGLGLTFPSSWVLADSFTVESVAKIDAIESDTALGYQVSAMRLDVLNGMWMPGKRNMARNDAYCMRWSVLGVWESYSNNYASSQEYAYRNAYLAAGESVGLVASYTKYSDADGTVSYRITYNTGVNYPSAKSYSAEEIAQMMNLPPGTVRSKLSRCRKYLKQNLEG
jgi:hypothetical protein